MHLTSNNRVICGFVVFSMKLYPFLVALVTVSFEHKILAWRQRFMQCVNDRRVCPNIKNLYLYV
mgnify:CR=1 FL=1